MIDVDTYQHAGLTIRIWAEEIIEEWMSPREDDGRLGVMFCDYRGYTLGDKDAPDPREHEVECDRCEGHGYVAWEEYEGGPAMPDEDDEMPCPKCEGTGQLDVSMIEYLRREHGARVVLPLFVYEHSGITMRSGGNLLKGADNMVSSGRFVMDGAGWDTSMVGFIFDTAESRKYCGCEDWTDERIEKSLDAEVELYAAYLEGQVYGYDILRAREEDGPDGPLVIDSETDEELGSLDEAEELESCGGFLDPDIWSEEKSHTIAEAKYMAEACVVRLDRERAEAYRWACADVVTV